MIARKLTRTLVAGAAAAAMLVLPLAGASNAQSYEPNMKIAMIPKLGNIGYFKVAWTGAQKACKELKYECKYLGPNEITAAAQVKLINSAVQQGYDAVLVAANDKDALVPALKNAMKRGVVVVTWDSDVSSAGRQLFVNQASSQGIAEGLLASTYELMEARATSPSCQPPLTRRTRTFGSTS